MASVKGTVVKVGGDGEFGFVGRHTITHLDGSRVKPAFRRDVYVNLKECDPSKIEALNVGMELVFDTRIDTRRENGRRAVGVRTADAAPIANGIEVHFLDQTIEHPMVHIRWCLKPEVLARMHANPMRLWALVLVAQERARMVSNDITWNRRKTVIQTVNGVRNIGDGQGYFSFVGPGEYDLVAYLICSTADSQSFWRRLKSICYGAAAFDIWDIDGMIKPEFHMGGYEATASYAHWHVSVPDGIFAKPLSVATQTWLGYFNLNGAKDECSARWSLAFAFTLGIPVYLFWEGLKRSWLFVLGCLHFLASGNPLSLWSDAFSPELSAYGQLIGSDEYEKLEFYRGWRNLLQPWSVALLLAAAALITSACILIPGLWLKILIGIGLVAGACIAAVLLIMFKTRQEESAKKRHEQQVAEGISREHLALKRLETFAVCGLETVPATQPQSVRLLYSQTKRRFCRTFGR